MGGRGNKIRSINIRVVSQSFCRDCKLMLYVGIDTLPSGLTLASPPGVIWIPLFGCSVLWRLLRWDGIDKGTK